MMRCDEQHGAFHEGAAALAASHPIIIIAHDGQSERSAGSAAASGAAQRNASRGAKRRGGRQREERQAAGGSGGFGSKHGKGKNDECFVIDLAAHIALPSRMWLLLWSGQDLLGLGLAPGGGSAAVREGGAGDALSVRVHAAHGESR